MSTAPQIDYEKIKGVHKIPLEELYTSGHRTCQGCESATTMRGFIKVAGPRTVVTGATGCMYVANTSYLTTPWIVPWMHTQLGAGGSSAVGMAAGSGFHKIAILVTLGVGAMIYVLSKSPGFTAK